ncbi:hypothetical protein KXX11_003714, partial [Aspergillus fumigatus]
GARRQADEAVAPEALATDHRLEQEAVLPAVTRMGQLQVERQRGFEVGKGLGDEGDAIEALQGQAFEFEFSDHGKEPPALAAPQFEGKAPRSFKQVSVRSTDPGRMPALPGHAVSGARGQACARARLPGRYNP